MLVINNSRVKKLQEDLSITCIRHSARIWQMHCTGELIDPSQGFEHSTFYKDEGQLPIQNETYQLFKSKAMKNQEGKKAKNNKRQNNLKFTSVPWIPDYEGSERFDGQAWR